MGWGEAIVLMPPPVDTAHSTRCVEAGSGGTLDRECQSLRVPRYSDSNGGQNVDDDR